MILYTRKIGGNFLKKDGSLWAASNSGILPDMNTTKPTKFVESGVIKVSDFQDGRGLYYTDINQSLFTLQEQDYTDQNKSKKIVDLNKTGIIDISSGGHHSVFLDKNGSLLLGIVGESTWPIFSKYKIIANNVKK